MYKKIFFVFFAVSLIFVFTFSVSASDPDQHGYYSYRISPFVMASPFGVLSNTSGDYEPSTLDDYDDLIVLRGGTVNDHLVQPETFGFWILFRILGYTPEQLNHYLDDFVRSALSAHDVDDITELDYNDGVFAIFYCFWRDVGLTLLKRNGSYWGGGSLGGDDHLIYSYFPSLLGFSSDILSITNTYYLEIVSKFFAVGISLPTRLFNFSAVDDFNSFWQSSDDVVFVKFTLSEYVLAGGVSSYRGVVNLDDSGISITNYYVAPDPDTDGSLSDIVGSIFDSLDWSSYVSWLPSSISSIFVSYFGILVTLIGLLVALKILHG